MKTTIELNGMRIFAHHGVLLQERRVGNEFEVSVQLVCDIPEAALKADCLDATVDYSRVAGIVAGEMAVASQLLETVAWRIAASIRREFPQVMSGRVRVVKMTPPIPAELESAAVSLEF